MSAQRSGSLITARFAGQQGREVFTVPGIPLDPRAAGTNNFLKQGATLVTVAGDIVDALAPILGKPAGGTQTELSSSEDQEIPRPLPEIVQSERGRVLEALGPSPIDIDEIMRCTGVETRKVHIILLKSSISRDACNAIRASSCLWSSRESGPNRDPDQARLAFSAFASSTAAPIRKYSKDISF